MHWISQRKTIKSNHANFINTKAEADNISSSTSMITVGKAQVCLGFILNDTWDYISEIDLNGAFKHEA